MATPATEGIEAAKEDNRKAKLASSIEHAMKNHAWKDDEEIAQHEEDMEALENFSINEKDTEIEMVDGVFSQNVKKLITNELVWFKTDGFSKEDLKKYLSQMVDEVFNA